MTIGQSAWYAPLETTQTGFVDAYTPATPERTIVDADALTIALDSIAVPKEHVRQGVWPHLTHLLQSGDTNILVLSTTDIGAQPQVQRVHYFGPSQQFEHAFTQFISDVIYLTSDFHPLTGIDITLHVVECNPSKEERAALLQAFNGLAASAGAVFPILLQYSSLAGSLGAAANKLLDALIPSEQTRISQIIKLQPVGEPAQIDLQVGRYVLLDRNIDLSNFSIGPDGRLLRGNQEVPDIPYAVFRVERANRPAPDFVVSQDVATLLTQLTQSQADPFKSSLEFVSDTMQGYKKFKDLQRYKDLAQQKAAGSLTPAEQQVMDRIQSDPTLKPFLPPA
jgi:hypothetical protein